MCLQGRENKLHGGAVQVAVMPCAWRRNSRYTLDKMVLQLKNTSGLLSGHIFANLRDSSGLFQA
jgi:hypothetical protein